jgi:lipid-A-disaccharide synthase-like uncharacterized protein
MMSGNAENKAYSGLNFTRDYSIDKAVKRAENNIGIWPAVFWVFWVLLTGGVVVLFYALENKWLY